jgi:hypothetical protein
MRYLSQSRFEGSNRAGLANTRMEPTRRRERERARLIRRRWAGKDEHDTQ